MAVDVRTDSTFDAETPRVVFERPLPERTPGVPSRYRVSPDGQRSDHFSCRGGGSATRRNPRRRQLVPGARAPSPVAKVVSARQKKGNKVSISLDRSINLLYNE